MKKIALTVLALLFTVSHSAEARYSSYSYHSGKLHAPRASHKEHVFTSTRTTQSYTRSSKSSTRVYGVKRDNHGRIERSQHAKDQFKRQRLCPSTGRSKGACPGYVIDHVVPLKRGGADSPSNMQWQTKAAAKQKDKWE